MLKRIIRAFIIICFFWVIAQQGFIDSAARMADMQAELDTLTSEKHEKQEPIQYDDQEQQKREDKQYKTMLGGLRFVVDEKKLQSIKSWHHQVFQMQTDREEQGIFEIPEEETKLWGEIAKELDLLTSFYLVGETYDYTPERDKVDYGEGIIKRLQQTISKSDGKKIKKLRDEYFANLLEDGEEKIASDKKNEDKGTDIEYEMRLILEPYKQLDVGMIILALFDDKAMENKAVYKVGENLKLEYEDTKKNGLRKLTIDEEESYPEYWEKIIEIIPSEILENFEYFKIGSDGEFGIYAYVVRLDTKGEKWCLNLDTSDYTEDGFFPYTIVHEISHYLSLNDQQVQYYLNELPPYPLNRFVEYDCVANKDAYIQKFYEEFWQDVTPIWSMDTESPHFYNRHKKEFVTPYAATSCAEDFAETFCAYVLMEKAPTPETRRKFSFFNQFPEIKEIKAEILKNIDKNQISLAPKIN